MARIAGIDLPKNKRGVSALTYIYGIGRTTAAKILSSANIDLSTKVKDWNDEQINGILRFMADTLKVEGELRGEVQQNIKRLQDIGCYRGVGGSGVGGSGVGGSGVGCSSSVSTTGAGGAKASGGDGTIGGVTTG